MLVLSLIHIYIVRAAAYKVLHSRSGYPGCFVATNGAPSECQQHLPE